MLHRIRAFVLGRQNKNGKLKNWAASFIAHSAAFGLVSPAFAFVDSPGVASPDGQSFSVNVHEFAIYCPPSWPISIGFDCSLGIYAVLRASTNSASPEDDGTILCLGVPGTVCPAGVRTVTGLPPNNPNPSSATVWIELWNSSQEFWGFGGDDVTGPMTITLAPCPPGQVRNPVTGRCEGSYTIKLENPATPVTTGTLAEVEPGKSVALVAQVYDENNVRVPGISVTLQSKVAAYSGGHQHDDTIRHTQHAGAVPATVASGTSFTFTAPAPAGDHTITAKCVDGSCGEDTGKVWVGHKGLQSLTTFSVYRLIGDTSTHPDNHYLTLTAASRVAVLAAFYQAKYPTQAVLHLNDASLERGGIFDLYPESSPNWKGPHFQHCRGTVIDIRANGAGGALDITSKNDPMIKEIKKLGGIVGADPVWEVPADKDNNELWNLRHFHTKLMGQERIQCP